MLRPTLKIKSNKIGAGFTFIELLIALTIFSIIAASIYHTLNAGIGVWQRGNALIAENQKMRVFFDIISRDIRNIAPFSGISSEWTANSISFHTIINTFEKGPCEELVRRIYYFDDTKGELKRARVIQKEGFDEKYEDEEVLLSELMDASFEFAYQSGEEYEWKSAWGIEDRRPRGVKIKIRLKKEDGEEEKTFEKIVFIISGQLGEEE